MEKKTISKKVKLFNLQQTTQDPVVGGLTLATATERVKDGLLNIRKLANKSLPLRGMLDKQGNRFLVPLKNTPEANAEPEWVLVLDHNEDEGEAVRPNFDPMAKHGLPLKKIAPMEITADTLVPIKLDALTVAGDSTFFKQVAQQMNLPEYIKTGLKKMYADL
jgi:hypothetical protein